MIERNGGLMDDLISREKAIDVLDKIFPADPMRNDYTQGITCGAALATEYIKQLPSAQPDLSEYSDKLWKAAYERGKAEAQDEIVRCKDCKQFRRWIDTDICFCDITEAEMSDNDFCSKAERITDDR